MNRDVDTFNSMHEVTGGCVEENKSKFFSHEWNVRSGRKIALNKDRNIIMNETNLQQIHCKKQKNSRSDNRSSFGMEFSVCVHGKQNERCYRSLKKTTIAASTALMHYNVCLIKKVYYGSRIYVINKR